MFFLEFLILVHAGYQYLSTVLTGFLGLCDHLTQSFATDTLLDQICYLLRSRRHLEPPLHEQHDDTLEADGESAGGHIIAGKLADHLVVTSAATAAATEFRHSDLENGSGIIRHTSYQRSIEHDLEIGSLRRSDAVHDLSEALGDLGL